MVRLGTFGESVGDAIRQALVLQNGLTPQHQQSVVGQLARFGVTSERCQHRARQLLPLDTADLFMRNFMVIDADPMVVAAVAALAEPADQLRTGVLPASCAQDIACTYGVNLMRAVSGASACLQPADRATRHLSEALLSSDAAPTDPAWLVPTALALGFGQKWQSPDSGPIECV
jgi:hypothetical protein